MLSKWWQVSKIPGVDPRYQSSIRAVCYCSVPVFLSMRSYISPNCAMLMPVEFKTLLSVNIDGHRGWPVDSNRLLLLNVVASSPQNLARPDRDMFLLNAISSIVAHIVACFNIGNLSFSLNSENRSNYD